jgi:hypothetical protein
MKTIETCKIAKNTLANYVIRWSPSAVCYRNYLVSFIKFCFRADMNMSMHLLSVFGKNNFRNESGKSLSASICIIGIY